MLILLGETEVSSHSSELWSAWFKSVLVLALRKGKTKLGLFLTGAQWRDHSLSFHCHCAVLLGCSSARDTWPLQCCQIAAGSHQIQMPPRRQGCFFHQ